MDIQQNQVVEEVQETSAAPAKKANVGFIVLLALSSLLFLAGSLIVPSYIMIVIKGAGAIWPYLSLFTVAGLIAIIVSMFLEEKVGKLVKVIGIAAVALGLVFLFISYAGTVFPILGDAEGEEIVMAIFYLGDPLTAIFAALAFVMVALKAQFGIKVNGLVVLFIVLSAISLFLSIFWNGYAGVYFHVVVITAAYILLYIVAKKLAK